MTYLNDYKIVERLGDQIVLSRRGDHYQEIVHIDALIDLFKDDGVEERLKNRFLELISKVPLKIIGDASTLGFPKPPGLENVEYKIAKNLLKQLNAFGWYSRVNDQIFIDVNTPMQYIPYTVVHEYWHSRQSKNMGEYSKERGAIMYATIYCLRHGFPGPWRWIRNDTTQNYSIFLIELERELKKV
jgi:hypothetical protein